MSSGAVSMTLQGDKDLEKLLAALELKVRKKIGRQGVRAGANVTLAKCKATAESMVGGNMGKTISDALQVKVAKRQYRGRYEMRVQHKADDKLVDDSSGERYYIPFALEFGHAAPGRALGGRAVDRKGVRIAARGQSPKDVPAIPYMRVGITGSRRRAAQTIVDVIFHGIEKEWNRGP